MWKDLLNNTVGFDCLCLKLVRRPGGGSWYDSTWYEAGKEGWYWFPWSRPEGLSSLRLDSRLYFLYLPDVTENSWILYNSLIQLITILFSTLLSSTDSFPTSSILPHVCSVSILCRFCSVNYLCLMSAVILSVRKEPSTLCRLFSFYLIDQGCLRVSD